MANGVNLLDAAVESGVKKFVFSSTCATFGFPIDVPIDESMLQVPINPYGESKFLFEKVLRWYDEKFTDSSISLCAFQRGGCDGKVGEDHRIETHLIPNILKVALGHREAVDIYGTDYPTPDGSCIRDYIHILDLSQAHILALKADKSARFNLGTGGGTSVKEVIQTCREVTGKDIKAVEKPRRPGDPPRLIASSDGIRNALGWKPKYQDIRTIVESAWAWHVKNPHGYGD